MPISLIVDGKQGLLRHLAETSCCVVQFTLCFSFSLSATWTRLSTFDISSKVRVTTPHLHLRPLLHEFPPPTTHLSQTESMASADGLDPAPRYSSPVPALSTKRAEQGGVEGLGLAPRAVQSSNPFESPDLISPANPNRSYTPSIFRDCPSTPGSSKLLLSPESIRNTSNSYTHDGGGWGKRGGLERINTTVSRQTFENCQRSL